ncbi:MAG: hypothetical protein ABSB99_02950 [Acidimicrobiales bacterium]|jgi:hypothetical protein
MSQFKEPSVLPRADSNEPDVLAAIEGGMPNAGTGTSAEASYVQVAERCAWSMVWLGAMAGGLSTWGMWWSSPMLTVPALVLILAAVARIVSSWISVTPRSRSFQLFCLAGVVVSVAASQ